MLEQSLITIAPPAISIVEHASTDDQVVALWLHGRSRHTRRAYSANAARFFAFVDQPLAQVSLGTVQAFADTLSGLAASSQAQVLAAVKSLFTFAHKIGYINFNVGAALQLPKSKNALAERILTEAQVHSMLALEEDPRNRIILRMLYGAGLRVSELCGLKWRDLQERDGGEGQVTIFGKGAKTRVVKLPPPLWQDLTSLRGDAGADDPAFRSRKGGQLDPSQVMRIVRAAAKRAGIAVQVSPHWLRHAHASHALDRGAPIHLVQATLGHSSVSTTGRYTHARPSDSSCRYLAL